MNEEFSDTVTMSRKSSKVGAGPAIVSLSGPDQSELQWPEETRLKYTSRHKVNKGEQSRLIQRILDQAIEEFFLDMAFERAIHKADERFNHQRDLLIEIAEKLDALEVAKRLDRDRKYAGAQIYVVCHFVLIESLFVTYMFC